MKKVYIVIMFLIGVFIVSCYDDSELRKRLDELDEVALASIGNQIRAIELSIESLKGVKNELKLTIKELQAKDEVDKSEIDNLIALDMSLNEKIEELSLSLNCEFTSIKESIDSTFITIDRYNSIAEDLEELKNLCTSKYKDLNTKINESIMAINNWINTVLEDYYTSDDFDAKLQDLKDDLELLMDSLKIILREFSIYFDDYDIGVNPGDTVYVGYSIVGATDSTIVRVLAQNGWQAEVEPYSCNEGRIMAIAPNIITRDEIIVLVDDGNGRVIMTEVIFLKGMVTSCLDTIEVTYKAGTVDIPISANINYHIAIPDFAESWLSIVETKSMRLDTVTLAYTDNDSLSARSCILDVVDENDKICFSIVFIQKEQDGIWKSLGVGQWFDMLSLQTSNENGIQEVEVLVAEKYSYYRIIEPYANDEQIIKAWGSSAIGGEKSLFIDFWIIENGTNVMWNGWWCPGILYNGAGTDLKAYLPSVLGSSLADEDAKSKFYEEKVVGFYPYWYIDGLGGFGTKYPCFLSLPGGPILENWLKDNGILN